MIIHKLITHTLNNYNRNDIDVFPRKIKKLKIGCRKILKRKAMEDRIKRVGNLRDIRN